MLSRRAGRLTREILLQARYLEVYEGMLIAYQCLDASDERTLVKIDPFVRPAGGVDDAHETRIDA